MWTIVFGTVALFWASAAYGYVPPMVEVPPMDHRRGYNQQRDAAGGRRVHYSYHTTSYHQQQQPQQQPAMAVSAAAPTLISRGYASARLNGGQQQQQSTSFISSTPYPSWPPERPECQNPRLRVFFKACHPPGAAPQSPVQCQPIPGQTNFRCVIKQQQSWPVVAARPAVVAACAPGTTYSNVFQQCVSGGYGHHPVVGSFSTGAFVPVAVPGRTALVQQHHSLSSVYRHCADDQCRTCIDDQCSTTGVLIPVSADLRGRVNSSTEVVAFGDAGRDVKQKCAGAVCKTCIDRICYDRSYPLLRVTAGCPPAVCEQSCHGFVYYTDQCPICRCSGFACREPCRSQNDCPAGATCQDQVCRYPELPANVHFDKVCTFSSQCSSTELCYNWRCGARPARSRHLEEHSCAVDQDCPAGYQTCADMTCWQGDAAGLAGQACTLDHQCPNGYFCSNDSCTNGHFPGPFVSSPPNPASPPPQGSIFNRRCDHDRQCLGGESCFENRCVTYEERRRIEQSVAGGGGNGHRYWTASVAPPPASGPDSDYQRRLDAYNSRRRTEEEAEASQRAAAAEQEQRRRNKELEDQQRRQEEEVRRRQHEEEENQRRREYEDAQRRTATEQEEARRRAAEETQRKAAEETQRRAAEEAQRRAAEETQRRAAEEAQRRAAEDTQRRAAEEAQKKATEEAQKTAAEETQRRAAEETQRRAAEETQRRAAEETQRRAAEETQRKAAEEAQRKAAEEAQRRAAEETQRRAAEETRKRASEEAQRRAAEEAQRERETATQGREQVHEEERRRQEEVQRRLPYSPVDVDVEIGEVPADIGAPPLSAEYDPGEDYARRMEGYYPGAGHGSDHDDNGDFYGRTREISRTAEQEDDDDDDGIQVSVNYKGTNGRG